MSSNSENVMKFQGDIDAYAKRLNKDVARVTAEVIIELFSKIVQKTPVDTGRARASWGVDSEWGTYVAGEDGKGENQLGKVTVQACELKRVWWIFNNLKYIRALEYGHSSQAPQGMVRLAVKEMLAEMKVK